MTTRRSSTLLAAVLAGVSQLASSDASANGYASDPFDVQLGSVVAANPTAIYYNPAGLGFSGTQLLIDAVLVMRSTSWTHAQGQGEVPEPAGFEGANYGTARSFLVAGGPTLAASLRLGEHLVLGGGGYIPFGGGTFRVDRNERFASSMYPGAADGITRWHAYEVGLSAIYATAGAAVRFGVISFGATFNLIPVSIAMKRAHNSAGTNDITREQRMSFDASKLVASFGLGAMWELLPNQVWLGASYQAQPGLGELRMDGTSVIDTTVGITDPTRSQNVTVHHALPDIVRSGVRIKANPSFELRMTLSFTRWSVNQTMCIGVPGLPCTVRADGSPAPGSGVIRVLRRNWQDTFGIHGGVSYWLTPDFELSSGVGYEPTAVSDATLEPLSADANNFAAALGVRARLLQTWLVALSYNHKQFLPRDTTGKSDLANPALNATSRGSDGGGKYEAWMATVHLSLAKEF